MTKDSIQPSDEPEETAPESPELAESPANDDSLIDLPGTELGDQRLPDPGEYEIAADELEAEELVEADDAVDDTPDKGDAEDLVIDDEEQLAEAEAVAKSASSTKPVKRKVTTAPVKKGRPTPSRDEARKAKSSRGSRKRTTPAKFVEQSAAELRKVNWPTGDQLRQYFMVVLIFVLFIIAFIGGIDLLLGWGLLKLLGAK